MTIQQIIPVGIVALLTFAASAQTETKTAPLFDGKTMTGWYTYLKEEGKNKDVSSVFSIVDGTIRINKNQLGYISTEKEYSNYTLSYSYRWAETTNTEVTRNSGLIYHAIGEDRLWCNGMELQMQHGDAGDLWLIPGADTNAAIKIKDEPFGGIKKGTRIPKWEANEKPLGEWNDVILTCRGNQFEHWVNGKKVLAGVTIDRIAGKIQFQAEGHEVWLRNIKMETHVK
jgi:hypothetical protein